MVYILLSLVLVMITLATHHSRGMAANKGIEPILSLVGRSDRTKEKSGENISKHSGWNTLRNMNISKMYYSALWRMDPGGYPRPVRKRRYQYVAKRQASGLAKDGKHMDSSHRLFGSHGQYTPAMPDFSPSTGSWPNFPRNKRAMSDLTGIPDLNRTEGIIQFSKEQHHEKRLKKKRKNAPIMKPLPPNLSKTTADIIITAINKYGAGEVNKFKEYHVTFEDNLKEGQLDLTDGQITDPVRITDCVNITYFQVPNTRSGVYMVAAPCMVATMAYTFRYKLTYAEKTFTGKLQVVLDQNSMMFFLSFLPMKEGWCNIKPVKFRIDRSLKQFLSSSVSYQPDNVSDASREELLRNENIINSWLYHQFRRYVAGKVQSVLRIALEKAIASIVSGGKIIDVCKFMSTNNPIVKP